MNRASNRFKYSIKPLVVCIWGISVVACGKNEAGTEMAAESYLYDLAVNYMEESSSINPEDHISFSWKMHDDTQNVLQESYEITLYDDSKEIWDSGMQEGGESVCIAYDGPQLDWEKNYFWEAKILTTDNREIKAAENGHFRTTINPKEFSSADWITTDLEPVESDNNSLNEIQKMTSYKLSSIVCSVNTEETGIVFGASEREYGHHYIYSIERKDGNVCFYLNEMNNKDNICSNIFELDEEDIYQDDFSEVRLIVIKERDKIKLAYNLLADDSEDIFIGDIDVSPDDFLGQFGFWCVRGEESEYYEDLRVEDIDGNIVLNEEFDAVNGCEIFAPYYTAISEGKIKAPAGYTLVSGGEVPAPELQTSFRVDTKSPISEAHMYATALGTYRVSINNIIVNEDYYAPGQSDYNQMVYYRDYNITDLIMGGENCTSAVLGHGRYNRAGTNWGDSIAFKCIIRITYEDGSVQTINSDSSWNSTSNGPIRSDDVYNGEVYDARFQIDDNLQNDLAISSNRWNKAVIVDYSDIEYKPATAYEVVEIERIDPVSCTKISNGKYVYDFGKNISGNIILSLKEMDAGDIVQIRYAEVLNSEELSVMDDEAGTIRTANLLRARNTDVYICSGEDNESYTPSLVSRGFRYVQIEGIPEEQNIEEVSASVISSVSEQTGYFDSSSEELNSLFAAIYQTQTNNFIDVPTDCPQRDERFGWAGDAQVFASTASFNGDVRGVYEAFAEQMRLAQSEEGAFSDYVPSNSAGVGANGWGDAGVIVVWEMYQQYGDANIIADNINSMCNYIDYLETTSDNYIRNNSGYADFSSLNGVDDSFANTAQCAYVSKLVAKMCQVVGDERLSHISDISDSFSNAWREAYLNEDGTIGEWQQDAYTMGLGYSLYPDEIKQNGADYLNTSVNNNGFRPTTGYISTPFLLPVLGENGYSETAYSLLLQEDYPSWLNMLKLGSTTIVENWEAISSSEEDGKIIINGSQDHFALGSVGNWFYTGILGIKRDELSPGFKHFYLEPKSTDKIESANGYFESVYGRIESSWSHTDEGIKYNFVIPANTTATIKLPGEGEPIEIGSGSYEYIVQ